jgi:hypothetical protein
MTLISALGWHYRIRIKANFWVYSTGNRPCQVSEFYLRPGQAVFLHGIRLTAQRYGHVHLGIFNHPINGKRWYVVSSEPTEGFSFMEYGLRFDIEENFLDDKSNGFQLEQSAIRESDALCRLGFVLAMTTLFLVSTGTQVVAEGKRRWVSPHWFRGNSYLRIGWQWIRSALAGWTLMTSLILNGEPDKAPAMAPFKQAALIQTNRFNLNGYAHET